MKIYKFEVPYSSPIFAYNLKDEELIESAKLQAKCYLINPCVAYNDSVFEAIAKLQIYLDKIGKSINNNNAIEVNPQKYCDSTDKHDLCGIEKPDRPSDKERKDAKELLDKIYKDPNRYVIVTKESVTEYPKVKRIYNMSDESL